MGAVSSDGAGGPAGRPPGDAGGGPAEVPAADQVRGPVEAAPAYMAKAREVLERDHRHATLAFLYRGGEVVHSESAAMRSRSSKDEFLGRTLPEHVAEHGADGVLLVTEATGPQGDLLVVLAEQADGVRLSLSSPFSVRRWPRRVLLRPVARAVPERIPAFDAVRQTWDGRTQPS